MSIFRMGKLWSDWFRRGPRPVRREPGSVRARRSWFGYLGDSLTAAVLLASVLAVVLCVALLWGWAQRDRFLSDMISKTLREKFPEWNITFGSAELDQRGRIVLADVTVDPHAQGIPLCTMQGLRITVDRDLLLQQRRIDIQSVEVNRPRLNVLRDRSGAWNWQNLPVPEGGDAPLPVIKIRDAHVSLSWMHPDFERALRAQVDAVDVDLQPTARHRYQFSGVGREQTLGESQFSGTLDTLHKTWELSGDLKGLQIDQPFLEVAALISPDARNVVTQLQQSQLRRSEELEAPFNNPAIDAGVIRSAELSGEDPSERTQLTGNSRSARTDVDVAPFSLKLTANLRFHCSQLADTAPDFSVVADLVSGQLAHPDLPLPLDKIQGQIAIDLAGIRIDQMQLASGLTSAEVTGNWAWKQDLSSNRSPDEFLVTIRNYLVNEQVRDFLPLGLRNFFDELKPVGRLSLSCGLRRGIDRPIDFDLFSAEVSDASVRHEMFAYPVTNLSGTIVRTDHGIGPEAWALDMKGDAAGQPITLTGTVLDPGPQVETVFDIHVNRLPIDEQFYRALRPNQRSVMEYIDLHGMADVHCVIVRKLEFGRKPIIRLTADVYDGSARIKGFPLGIRQFSGHVRSDENGWQLTRLEGVHGDTQLNGFGTVVPVNDEWKLEMTIAAQQAHFDRDLYLAVKQASSEVRQVWDLLRPRGDFGVTAQLSWTSGNNQVRVDVPLMKLHSCEVNPTAFPWRLSDIQATVAIAQNGVVIFENLKARHDQSTVETSGTFVPHQDYWQLRFEDLVVDDLMPNHEFLAALPVSFRKLVELTKLNQPASLSGKLEFKGDYAGQTVTAAWETTAVLNQVDVYAGVELQNVSGTIRSTGSLDRNGIVTVPKGTMALDSLWVSGYHVTDVKGPFRVEKDQIILGSPKMFESESPEEEWSTVSREERLTGRVFNGELFLDLLTKRTDAMPYWLRCTLSRADLEQWAIQNNYGQANIKGEVNGYIDLAGDSVSTRNTVGNGRLLISPAALYEVPVIFQMFQGLRLGPVDDTAFRDAYAQFRIIDEKFVFDEIGLLGDSMSLFGQGTIRFDRTIDLDFVYRPPRRGGRVNLASQVLNRLEGVLPVLFTVEVEGTLDLPKVTVQDGVRETLKGFTRLLEMGPGNMRPPKVMPPPRIRIQTPPQASQPLVPAF